MYRPITYLVAKMVEELTIFFFLSLILTVMVFAPCHLGGSYILFWLVNFVTTATGIGAIPPYDAAAVLPDIVRCECSHDSLGVPFSIADSE